MRKSSCSLWKSFNECTSGQDFSQGELLLHILLKCWENGVLRKFTSWYHLKEIFFFNQCFCHISNIFKVNYSDGWLFSFETEWITHLSFAIERKLNLCCHHSQQENAFEQTLNWEITSTKYNSVKFICKKN